MAQIEGGGDSGHKKAVGVKKAKKLSTRVDMTPMVDLGFLLITFFIFTTTMSSPKAMNLNMPKDTKNQEELNKAKESGALTIMLGKNNSVFYYEGQLLPDGSNFKSANFSTIRDEPNCPKIWAENNGDKTSCLDRDFVVVIKPDQDATYKNTVDILDEMTINNVKRYAMIDITPQEEEVVQKSLGGK